MAGIIKVNKQSTDVGVQAIAFNLDDIHSNADTIVGQVRSQAAKIVAQAKDQAAALRETAQREGRKAALDAVQQTAQADLDQKLSTLLPALQQTIDAISDEREQWRKHWEAGVLDLAVAIAGRVLRREVEASPDIAVELVRESLELASGNSRIQIRLHPQDHASLGPRIKTLAAQVSKVAETEVLADEQVSLGGCIISTDYGEIDQRFESQLARIRKELG